MLFFCSSRKCLKFLISFDKLKSSNYSTNYQLISLNFKIHFSNAPNSHPQIPIINQFEVSKSWEKLSIKFSSKLEFFCEHFTSPWIFSHSKLGIKLPIRLTFMHSVIDLSLQSLTNFNAPVINPSVSEVAAVAAPIKSTNK